MPGPCPHWAEEPWQALPRGSVSSPRRPASSLTLSQWPLGPAQVQPEHEGTGQQSCSQRGRGPSGDGVTQSRAALSSHALARLGAGGRTQTLRGAWSPRLATRVWPSPRRRCVSQDIYFEARPGVGAAIRRGQVGESIWWGVCSGVWGMAGGASTRRRPAGVVSGLAASADTEGAFLAKARGTGCPTAWAAARASLLPSLLARPLSLCITVSPDPSKSQQGCISPAQSGRRLLYLKFVPTPQTLEAACFATPHKCRPPLASAAGARAGAGGHGRRLWPGVAAAQWPRSRAC